MAVVTTSENGYISVPSQVLDGVITPSYKWFSLQQNVLNGSYHPIDVAAQIGWWGTTISDVNGVLSPTPSITVDYGQLTSVHSIEVTGDSLLGEYPVDFTIEFFNGSTSVFKDNITGNAQIDFKRSYTTTYDCTKYVITVSKINKPSRTVKLLQGSEIANAPIIRVDTLLPKTADLVLLLGNYADSVDVLTPKVDYLSYDQVVKADNPAAYWRLNEAAGTVALDASNNGHTASLINSPTMGCIGAIADNDTAIKFGVNQAATVPTNPTLLPTSFSLEAWANIESLAQWNGIMTNMASGVYAGANLQIGTSQNIGALIGASGSGYTYINTTWAPTTGVWYHIVLTYDDITQTVNLYVNGKLEKSITHKIAAAVGSPWYIGCFYTNSPSTLGANGTIDEVAIYQYVLTATQVANHYAFRDLYNDVNVSLASTEVLTPKTDDFSRQKTFMMVDALTPKTDDFATQKKFTMVDILTPKTDDVSKPVTAKLYPTDSILVKYSVENIDVHADLYTGDILTPMLAEDKLMTNIHTVMDAPERRVYGKVEITYTDPFMDQSITATANDTNPLTDPNQTADNMKTPPTKWLTLYDNKLDGSQHVMPGNGEAEVGWWSRSLSAADGSFSVSPQLTITFDVRGITSFNVTGDSVGNVYPIDFIIDCYDASNTLLRTVTITGNTLINWSQDISNNPVLLCTKMILTINKINRPNYQSRILEFMTSIVQTYTGDDRVVLINLLEERDTSEGSLPVGNITSNELDIRLDNTDRYFDPATTTSPLSTLLKPNRRVKAWLGAEIIPGQIEWHQLGIFWTTSWSSPKADVVTNVTARDRLNLLAQTTYTTSVVKTNVSLAQLAIDVLEDYGLTSAEYQIDQALTNMIVPVGWFDRISHREALRKIAEAALAVVYCDSNAVVKVGDTITPPLPYTTLSEDTNIYNHENPQDWTQVVNDVNVKWSPLAQDTAQEVLGISQLAMSIDPGESVTLDLDFNTKPCINVGAITIGGGTDLQLTDSKIYAWGVQITVYNAGTVTETLDSVNTIGTPLKASSFTVNVQDANSIRDLSKLSYTLDNHLIQTRGLATTIANQLRNTYSDPLRKVVLDTKGDIAIELGDRVTLPIGSDGILTSQKYLYDGALSSTVEALKIK